MYPHRGCSRYGFWDVGWRLSFTLLIALLGETWSTYCITVVSLSIDAFVAINSRPVRLQFILTLFM